MNKRNLIAGARRLVPVFCYLKIYLTKIEKIFKRKIKVNSFNNTLENGGNNGV